LQIEVVRCCLTPFQLRQVIRPAVVTVNL
jgi:hypothetical protein